MTDEALPKKLTNTTASPTIAPTFPNLRSPRTSGTDAQQSLVSILQTRV